MACDYYGNEPGEPIHISKFAEKAKDELQDASARIRSKLANAGIALTPPVELAPDRAGTGVKVGPHPLREKIEALIPEARSCDRTAAYRKSALGIRLCL
jgi:hypothetical protein